MAFKPNVDDILNIGGVAYRVTEHPGSSGTPFIVQGRQSTVYQLAASNGAENDKLYALKVFESRYRTPGLVGLNDRFRAVAQMPGLRVCDREILSISQDEELLRQYPDLNYAVLMPWIPGPTWMEVMLERTEFTPADSLKLARALAGVLLKMEEKSMAHCDLTGGNILIPAFASGEVNSESLLELVDVEQLYLPTLPQPAELAPPLPGYAYRKSKPQWRAEADRMAGAILLAEILGWCDKKVRELTWGEHYFDPKEIQQPDSDRYQTLRKVLREQWDKPAATLLKQAWRSDDLMDCPTFGEWLSVLPQESAAIAQEGLFGGIQEVPETQAKKEENGTAIHALLSLANQLERDGNIPGALAACRQAKDLYTTDEDLEDELDRTIERLQSKMEGPSIVNSGAAMGAAALAGSDRMVSAPDVGEPATEETSEEPPLPSPTPSLEEEVIEPPEEEPAPLQDFPQETSEEFVSEMPAVEAGVSRETVETSPTDQDTAPAPAAPAEPEPMPPVAEPEEPAESESKGGCGGCFSWIILLLLAIVAGVAIYYFVFMQHNQQVVDTISRIIGQEQPAATVVPAMTQEITPSAEVSPMTSEEMTPEPTDSPAEAEPTTEAGATSLRGMSPTTESRDASPRGVTLTPEAGATSPRSMRATTEVSEASPREVPSTTEAGGDTPASAVSITQTPASTPVASAEQEQSLPGTPRLGQTWTRPADGVAMAGVPAGQFEMGTTASQIQDVLQLCREYSGICREEWFEAEQPAHSVTLAGFWIDRTEVTNAKFVEFLNAQDMSSQEVLSWIDLDSIDARIEQTGDQYQARSGYEAHPVTLVTWEGAQSYCQWAGGRLPTEAEWEYTARGPESRIFPWGNEFEDANLNYKSSSDGYTQTAPVSSFLNGASWVGALDMSGNAAEWTADWFEAYTSGSQSNPEGPATGQYRVNRGGSFLSEPFETRGASRSAGNPTDTNRAIGFRCAVSSQ